MLLYCASSESKVSLEQACVEIGRKHGISLSKQALDGRFNESSMQFIKSILGQALQCQVLPCLEEKFLGQFNQVRITDSTRFDVPSMFRDILKGFNGRNSSKAGVSIQYEFDIKNGKVLNTGLFGATKSDSKYGGHINSDISPGDLIIRDLGYYSKDNLIGICKKEAYFISRLNSKAGVYEQKAGQAPVKLSFERLHRQLVENGQAMVEKKVFIGNDQKLPVRLVVQLMPEEVYRERLAKLEKYNKANGHKTSQEIKHRLRFNLFVTNIGEETLPLEKICLLYKIRWQVELAFKNWKSHMNINKLQKMKYERYLTVLYSKLLFIFLGNEIILNIRKKLYEATDKILSLAKASKTLTRMPGCLRALAMEPQRAEKILNAVERILSEKHWQEKRKNRVGLLEIIEIYSCKPNNYAIFKEKKKAA